MKRKLILLTFGLLATVATKAGKLPAAIDSIGIEKKDGKRFILHRVDLGQTLYSISRRYSSNVDAIKSANPDLGESVRFNQVLRIPLAEEALSRKEVKAIDKAIRKEEKEKNLAEKEDRKAEKEATREARRQDGQHIIEPGQTLYSIAQRYGISVADLRQWNSLTSDNVYVGQALIVIDKTDKSRQPVIASNTPKNDSAEKSAATTAKTEPIRAEKPAPRREEPAPIEEPVVPENPPVRPGDSGPMPSSSNRKITESGIAEIIDADDTSNKFLALHRSAPTGTLLMVRNEFNDQSIWVRVIGKLPATGVNDKILIKLSAKAFEKLSPNDRRFRAEVSYLAQ